MEGNTSIQSKEQMIIGTIISCNAILKELPILKEQRIKPLFESNQNSSYHYNMLSLYSNIVGVSLKSLNENVEIVEQSNFVKMNEHNNHLAYFQKVYDFLNGFELGVQQNLNESLNQLSSTTTINTFKTELRKYIEELVAIDEYSKYSGIDQNIINIKLFAKKPIYVCGFDIVNILRNESFQKEIIAKFDKNFDDIIAVCFDRINKQILIVTENLVICYDILTDRLTDFNSINPNDKLPKFDKLKFENYKQFLCENINNTIADLYINENHLNLKYNDNLFNDAKRTEEFSKIQEERRSKTGVVKY